MYDIIRGVARYEWARSAAAHGVSRDRARHVIENAPAAFPLSDDDGVIDQALLLFVGDDLVRVFHVMKMRRKYRPLYEQLR